MGFFSFLKPKKGQKRDESLASQPFPPLPAAPELYSELPNLPEAPETSGLPEIELPPPLKGLEELELPEVEEAAEPLFEKWPETSKPEEAQKLLPAAQKEVPEVKPFAPRLKTEPGQWLASYGTASYLSVYDFRTVMGNFDSIIRIQKRHHKLSGLKKEENLHYEDINALLEDMQRKLMFIDKTLFE